MATNAARAAGRPPPPAIGVVTATAERPLSRSVKGADTAGSRLAADLAREASQGAPAWVAPGGAPLVASDEQGTRPSGRTMSMWVVGKTPSPPAASRHLDGSARTAPTSRPAAGLEGGVARRPLAGLGDRAGAGDGAGRGQQAHHRPR